MSKKILALFLSFVTIFLSCPVAFAVEVDVPGDTDPYIWSWIRDEDTIGFSAWMLAQNRDTDSGCSISDNGFHDWYCDNPTSGMFTNEYGVQCKYCGLDYKAFIAAEQNKPVDDVSSSEAFNSLYSNAVDKLPAQGYSSNGGLVWTPTLSDLVDFPTFTYYFGGSRSASVDSGSFGYGPLTFTFNGSGFEISCSPSSGTSLGGTGICKQNVRVPVTGTYRRMAGPCVFVTGISNKYGKITTSCSYAESSSAVYCVSGGKISIPETSNGSYRPGSPSSGSYSCHSISGYILFPSYAVTLSEDVAPDYTTTYDPSTRVGNYNFDLGIKNVDNSFTYVTNNYIVNETNNTYTNPVTGVERPITNWNYDYSDRSYNLNFEGGDTTNVTYGDEYVTINETHTTEGDTVTVNEGDTITTNEGNSFTINVGDIVTTVEGDTITVNQGDTVTIHSGDTITNSGGNSITYNTGDTVTNNYTVYYVANDTTPDPSPSPSPSPDPDPDPSPSPSPSPDPDPSPSPSPDPDPSPSPSPSPSPDPSPSPSPDPDPSPSPDPDADGWAWWKEAWADFRLWLSGIFSSGDDDSGPGDGSPGDGVLAPGGDSPGDGEDDGWSFGDLLKAIIDGVWAFVKGVPGAIFGGLAGLIDGFVGITDFFGAFDSGDPDSVFNTLNRGGDDLWG